MEEQVFFQKQRGEGSTFNLKEIFFKYIRFLPLYIIFVALSLMGAYIYLRYANEVYRSTGQIVIRDDRNAGSAGNDKLDILMQTDSRKNVQTEIEILQSYPVMSRVVEALNLNFNYFAKGRFKEMNVYRIVPFQLQAYSIKDSSQAFTLNLTFTGRNSFKINGSTQTFLIGQKFSNQFGEFSLVRLNNRDFSQDYKVVWQPTTAQAGALLKGLVVAPKQNTGILTITMEASNPHLAADVINSLVEEYKEVTIEDKNEVTRKSLQFIDANLRERENELDSIKRIYVAYQKANDIVDPGTQSSNYFNRVEDALKQEQEQRLKLSNATMLQDYLLSEGTNRNTVPSSLGVEDQTLAGLIGAYNTAQLERRELLANAPEGNIIVQQKTLEVETLRNKILENIKNIRTAYGSIIGTLQSTNGSAQSQIRTLPSKKQELLNIEQQIASKALIYNTMLGKREESAIALASTISNTKVLMEAAPNLNPVSPNRKNTRILAIFIGLVIPTIIVVILELSNDKVTSRNDIEKVTDVTILGEIGHSPGGNALIVTPSNRKFIAEQFRILRSNLQYVLKETANPVIMVTSSFSGEGKSFVSTNIGAVMALANKKTIILEFDIRKPKIVSGLGLSKQNGLTNFLLGQATLEELPVQVKEYENLFVLPCGPIPPNPGELLLDVKFNALFDYLRKHFDVIVMDTAPVGMVSDALTLSKFANCTLYLVRQGYTYKKQIRFIEDFNNSNKLPKINIILNDVKAQAGYGYGYGYGNGYGYGEGYFEEDDQSSPSLNRWFRWLGVKNGTSKKHKKKKV